MEHDRRRHLPPQEAVSSQDGMRAFYQSARNDLLASRAMENSFVGSLDTMAQFAVKVTVKPALQAIHSACGERLSSVIVLKEGPELIVTSDHTTLHTVHTPEALKKLLDSGPQAAKGVKAVLEDSIALAQRTGEKPLTKPQVGIRASTQPGAQRSTREVGVWRRSRANWI